MLSPSVSIRELRNGYEYEYEGVHVKGQEKEREGMTGRIELPKLIDQQRSIKHL